MYFTLAKYIKNNRKVKEVIFGARLETSGDEDGGPDCGGASEKQAGDEG